MEWTREQTILTLELYCRIPFSKASNSNPEICKLAELMGRSVNSVKMKIGNFGSFDEELMRRGIVGLANHSRLDEEIWNMYCGHWDKLANDAAKLYEQLSHHPLPQPELSLPLGTEREAVIRQRINQSFFRATVLSSYDNKCCITHLSDTRLLEACHIISWAEDESLRTNPTNGLCMNALFHKAYDKLLMSITPDYYICISDKFIDSAKDDSAFSNYLVSLKNKAIALPNRFQPNKEFLDSHYQKFRESV